MYVEGRKIVQEARTEGIPHHNTVRNIVESRIECLRFILLVSEIWATENGHCHFLGKMPRMPITTTETTKAKQFRTRDITQRMKMVR